MNVYAISDLHLSFNTDKPMDIFGEKWEDYEEKVLENVNSVITNDDCLIIAGDISWAMQLNETEKDFEFLGKLNGKKIVVRGNHDYWWKSISSVREKLETHNTYALQNDSIKIENIILCGTRGWVVPEGGKTLSEEDKKIYDRELIRLEMALKSASVKRTSEGDKIIAVLHFPPFNSTMDDNEFTALLERYKVDIVVFGHLHGKTKYSGKVFTKNGISYFLTSCDKINFNPIKIM